MNDFLTTKQLKVMSKAISVRDLMNHRDKLDRYRCDIKNDCPGISPLPAGIKSRILKIVDEELGFIDDQLIGILG